MVSDRDLRGCMKRVALLLNITRDLSSDRLTRSGDGDDVYYRMEIWEGDELVELIRTINDFALECASEASH